jgi:WD40 repeat protein
VRALAVGLNDKLYSGSSDMTIRVWSGDDGTHLQTLEGHTGNVRALAVGLDGKVYSGSSDMTIRVWSPTDGTHLQTLEGHTEGVTSLAVGLDGNVYSGSSRNTIRVWSLTDGTHHHTLEALERNVFAPEGYAFEPHVFALSVMHDGTLVSGGAYQHLVYDSYMNVQEEECAVLKMW